LAIDLDELLHHGQPGQRLQRIAHVADARLQTAECPIRFAGLFFAALEFID